jgi:hypothetical protein
LLQSALDAVSAQGSMHAPLHSAPSHEFIFPGQEQHVGAHSVAAEHAAPPPLEPLSKKGDDGHEPLICSLLTSDDDDVEPLDVPDGLPLLPLLL